MTDLKSYIEINHHLMTVKEMAEELRVRPLQVYEICHELKITPITPAVRLKEFITAHKDKTAAYIAELTGYKEHYVLQVSNDMGIKLKRKKAEKEPEKPRADNTGKLSFTSHLFPNKYDPMNFLDYNYGD